MIIANYDATQIFLTKKKIGASARIIAANSLSTSVTSTDAFLIVAKTSSRSSSVRSLLRILIMDI